MSNYEIYVIILCVIVFTILTALSTACVWIISRLSLRLIRCGEEDERILAEHRKKQNKKPNKIMKIVDYAFSGIVCLVLVTVFVCSLFISCTDNPEQNAEFPTSAFRVVRTGSMSYKNSKNEYLTENDLNDHIQTFDLIRTEKMPDEMDLELYDIVVYETDGMLILHRIVEIEEPNTAHPDCRYFKLQGDAVDSPDRFPVRYEQMRAIYRGERVPFIGSFILFLQSPAGWLCILLIFAAMTASPILENVLNKEKEKRLLLYLVDKPEDPPVAEEPEKVETETVEIETVETETVETQTVVTSHKRSNYSTSGKVGEVSIGVINSHYKVGDVVDIHSLKQKKLINKSCKRVKILEKGTLNKALTVYADGFSSNAAVKIARAGGQTIKISIGSDTKQSEQQGGDQND